MARKTDDEVQEHDLEEIGEDMMRLVVPGGWVYILPNGSGVMVEDPDLIRTVALLNEDDLDEFDGDDDGGGEGVDPAPERPGRVVGRVGGRPVRIIDAEYDDDPDVA